MADSEIGVLHRGFSLALHHQRILWWVFAINLILAGLGASGAARTLSRALHHSLAGQRLADGFDLGIFLELITQPDVRLFSHSGGSLVFARLYFLFILFITPGIISVYFEDRSLTTGEFFDASGAFFWAFVRLVLWSLIPFIVVNFLYAGIRRISDYVGDRAIADQASFYVLVIGCIPVLLLFVWVRLWFDLAQVRAVARNDRAMRRNATRMFGLALRRAWHTYWAYVAIGVLIWIITVIALVTWSKVPARAVPITFLLLQIVMLAHIFGRLWQKACATTWYRLNPEPVAAAPLPYQPAVTTLQSESRGPVTDVDVPLSDEVEAARDNIPESPRE